MKLGRLLRSSRRAHGLSLSRLARRVRVSTSYLCRIEHDDPGRRASDRLLGRIAHELALPLDEVFASAQRLAPDVVRWLIQNPDEVARVRAAIVAHNRWRAERRST